MGSGGEGSRLVRPLFVHVVVHWVWGLIDTVAGRAVVVGQAEVAVMMVF